MTNHSPLNVVDLEQLSGAPPVLRTEDAELYHQIRAYFMECFTPQDIVQWYLVDRLVESAWLIKRYSRHQTVAVERWYRRSLEFQAQRMKLQNARKERRTSNLADKMRQTPADVAHLQDLEDTILESITDVDEILERTPTELEHNQALEKGIIFQEQLDKLTSSATKRFNETLVLLEHYNEGLGRRLRQAAQKLLEPSGGQLPQTEAPSIVSVAQPRSSAAEIAQNSNPEVDQAQTSALQSWNRSPLPRRRTSDLGPYGSGKQAKQPQELRTADSGW
jgi:hypothetical protein